MPPVPPRLASALAVCALVALGAAAPPYLHARAGDAAVTIDNFTFTPASITVPAGTRVVWTNHDDIPHQIVGVDDPRALKSPPLDTDDRFAFTFAKAGTYKYFCGLHPMMQGTVVVR